MPTRCSMDFASLVMETVVYYCLVIVLKREFQGEMGTLADDAIYFYFAMVCFYDGLHIAKAQPESFYIVQVAGMRPIEFLEDAALGLLAHPDAVIFDADDEAFRRAMC